MHQKFPENSTNDARETFGTIEYTREGSTIIFYTDRKSHQKINEKFILSLNHF